MPENLKSEATELFERIPALREAASALARSRSGAFAVTESGAAAAAAPVGRAQIKVDDEVLFRVEGDILLDQDQLALYELEKGLATATPVNASPQLVGILSGGKQVRWRPGLVLTYCVLKSTFVRGGDAGYQSVVSAMRSAARDWESTCGVSFQHKANLDTSNTVTPAGVVFTVREIDAGGQFIAAAFFPNDPRHRRRVLIDPSFYTMQPPPAGFSKVGVIRHELGHVLGFRHEHIRSGAPAICPDEDTSNTINLTAYDPQSCMHYFCGGVGTRELAITQVDRVGSQTLYGPPLNSVSFVE